MAAAPVCDKSTIESLATKMNNPDFMNEFSSCKTVLSKVMLLMSSNADLTPLLPSAVKLLAHSDMCIKKVAGYILCQYGANDPEMILMGINSLIKDCQDSSPMVRGLALKNICSLQHEAVLEYADRAILKAFADKSSYVRRAAVIGSVKLFHYSNAYIRDSNIIDQLYDMIRDPDPVVVVNCLSALEEILQEEGGIVMNRNIAHYLLNKIKEFPTWCQQTIVTVLNKYEPASEDEIFDIMNLLDPLLKHGSCSIACTSLELFLHLVKPLPHLQGEVCRRSKDTLVGQLGSTNVELTYALLDFLSSLSTSNLQVFSSSYQSFFLKYKDPNYLKMKKMTILSKLLTQSNEKAILDELCLHCTDNSREVSKCALKAVADVSSSHDHLSKYCIEKFQELLEGSSSHVICNVLQVLQTVQFKDKTYLKEIITTLGGIHRTVLQDSVGTMALLSLLGELGQDVEDVPYILEEIVESIEDHQSSELKQQLLTTTLKVFFHRPGEIQTLLGTLFEACMRDSDRCVKEQAEFYYRLLETDVQFAKSVICGEDNVAVE